MSDKGPSGYKVEMALASFMAARARLLSEDEGLQHDEAQLEELLGPETGTIEEILARVLRAARYAKAMADSAASMIDDLQAREQRYAKRNDTLRGTALAILEALERNKVETAEFTVLIRKPQQQVVLHDEALVPDIYVELVRKVDRATIASVLKSGGKVPGATLELGLSSLTVRTR